MNKNIANVVVGLPVEGHFDYLIHKAQRDKIAVGQRVWVSFGKGMRIGYVVGLSAKSSYKNLKPLSLILDDGPCMDSYQLKLAKEFSAYYGCSLGEAIETALPTNLKRRKKSMEIAPSEGLSSAPRGKPQTKLLHDTTLSQRWEHINEQIDRVLMEDRGVIFLVPEMSLIDEVVSQLTDYFEIPIAILDKRLSAKEESAEWMEIKAGHKKIVVGPRSAVFAPLINLGLVIIYDEENPAYKQEQTPHYHAHEVALMRSKVQKNDVLYVSCAPSAEVWADVAKKKIDKITLKNGAKLRTQLIDMSNYNPQRTSIVSFPLRNQIEQTLRDKGKVLLYFNRKGFSTRTSCNQCGFILRCKRCNINLIYSYSKKKLVCRLCNSTEDLPKICPQCGSSYLRSTGTGVEKLESDLARIFPQAKMGHFDKDTLSIPKQADIVIATQAIHKIIGMLSVDLIAVLRFDSELHRMDFRSAQKTFSTFMNLKKYAKDKFVIQTNHIDDYCVRAIAKDDYAAFYRKELKFRRELGFPPYNHLLAVRLRGSNEETVLEQTNDFHEELSRRSKKGIEVLDPHPDVLPKLRDKYRFTIMIKGKSVKKMLSLVKKVLKDFKKRSTTITLNVDP